MKDYVFIGWSRNRDVAIAIKNILDKRGFVCVIGGVYEGNPDSIRMRKGTVNETINYQMNHCDQSIMLFQKIDDNLAISGNLIYELGYISAQYNFIESATKLHIFKIDITDADDNLFPSDLHGIWGTKIDSAKKTTEQIAEEICETFLNNQSQIKKSDKFKLLNSHYYIEYEMRKHFENPTMSDYDLAMNILVYVQAAFCYQEQNDIKLKIELFRNKLTDTSQPSMELDWVTNYALQTLTLFCITIPDEENGQLSMKGATFRGLLNKYEEIGEKICQQANELTSAEKLVELMITAEYAEQNEFESWLIAQMQEHVTYLILVYLNNDEVSESETEKYAQLGVEYCLSSIANLEILKTVEGGKVYANLLLCFAYKNLCTFYTLLNRAAEAKEYETKSYKLRKELYSFVSNIANIKPSLKDYVALEYLLQVIERIKHCDDEYEIEDCKLEIAAYIDRRKKIELNRNFMLNILIEEFSKIG